MMLFQGVGNFVLCSLVVWSSATKHDDAEWVETDDLAGSTRPTTKIYGSRRTTTKTMTTMAEPEFTPPTSSRKWTSRVSKGGSSSTFRPTTSLFAPTSSNLTDTITTLLKNFAALTTDIKRRPAAEGCPNECLTNVVRLEMFTIASGVNHFVVPPNADEKIELKQREKASAVGALWLDLFCSEDVAAVLSNVTEETVTRHYPSSTSLTNEKMRDILKNVFDKLDAAIEEDTFLDTMYIVEQIRYANRLFNASSSADNNESTVYFPLDELSRGRVSAEKLVVWLNNLNIRKFLIHKQFLEMKHEKSSTADDRTTVRSILKVARERCCIDRMQKIYANVLEECAKNFVVADYPLGVTRRFVDKLTRAIEVDEKVNDEWAKVKEEMLEETRITKDKSRRV